MNTITTHATIHPRRVPIDDGRWVSIRPIERSDAFGLSEFYARLSPESRRRRFLGAASPIGPALIAEFATDPSAGVVGVLAEAGPDDGAIVAHASVLADSSGGAEVAFAVADAFQSRGIGHALVESALELARRRGLRRVSASLLLENAPMRRLLRSARCRVVADGVDAGVEEITLELAAA